MLLEEARSFARSLPEVTEEPHFDKVSFRIRGKIFATLPPDGGHIHIFVEPQAVHLALMEAPSACQELWWGSKLVGVRVHLPAADERLVQELLEAAWRLRAPKRVLGDYDALRRR